MLIYIILSRQIALSGYNESLICLSKLLLRAIIPGFISARGICATNWFIIAFVTIIDTQSWEECGWVAQSAICSLSRFHGDYSWVCPVFMLSALDCGCLIVMLTTRLDLYTTVQAWP